MKVTIHEIIEGHRKNMGKFSAIGKFGELIKFKSDLGEGYAHFVSEKPKNRLLNCEIDVETMYEKIEKFRFVPEADEYLSEENAKCRYNIHGTVDFVYSELGKKELIKVKCGGWEFFLGQKEIDLKNIELGMKVSFVLCGLELYDITI